MIKAKNPLYDYLQRYNDNLIDKKVNLYYENFDENEIFDSFSQFVIFTTIFNLNLPIIVRDFQRLIKNSLTPDDIIYKNIVNHSAEKTTRLISEKETERVLKNLKYVDKTLEQSKIDINKFNSLSKKLGSGLSRKELLEKTLIEGKTYKGRDLSYKQLNNLAKDLEKYKQNHIDYQLGSDINDNAIANGLKEIYTHKVWIWSGLENTRHSSMDGTIVEYDEKFEVINDNTGEIDYLLFPGDVENYSNPGNVINCKCSWDKIRL